MIEIEKNYEHNDLFLGCCNIPKKLLKFWECFLLYDESTLAEDMLISELALGYVVECGMSVGSVSK